MATVHTTLLIPNLHCPTCATRIEDLIAELEPCPTIENMSIIDHTVTIKHDETISAFALGRHLESAAYEVYDMFSDSRSTEQLLRSRTSNDQFSKAVERWHPAHSQADGASWEEHAKHCQSCADYKMGPTISEKGLITVATAQPDIASYQAIFSIEGMTCSSCVGNASEALGKVHGVIKADVSLVSMSATVEFRATEAQAFVELLIEAVEDVGYGIELTEMKPAPAVHRGNTRKRSDSVRVDSRTVSLRIDGMHCAQCPSRILATIDALDIEVERAPELKHSVLTISYTPSAPDFTIRSIISRITAIDASFSLSVYHPQSVEERSRKMLSKERTSISIARILV